ncbi:MAG: Trp biosynthesis-associated membrane protein [Jatrophihabitantaceae bacterium]
MRSRGEFASALLLDLLGAAGALLISARTWQSVLTPRPRPFADDVLRLSGRTIDPASTALALVALAGIVAVLATRGRPRQLVGAVLALSGAGLVWRGLGGLSAIGTQRARSLVESEHSGGVIDSSVLPRLTVHPAWPVLSAACGVLVLVAGVLVAVRGARWAAMSARYDSPGGPRAPSADPEAERARADASLWAALERGDDPTSASS